MSPVRSTVILFYSIKLVFCRFHQMLHTGPFKNTKPNVSITKHCIWPYCVTVIPHSLKHTKPHQRVSFSVPQKYYLAHQAHRELLPDSDSIGVFEGLLRRGSGSDMYLFIRRLRHRSPSLFCVSTDKSWNAASFPFWFIFLDGWWAALYRS